MEDIFNIFTLQNLFPTLYVRKGMMSLFLQHVDKSRVKHPKKLWSPFKAFPQNMKSFFKILKIS